MTRLYRGYVVLQQAQNQLDFDTTDTQHLRFPFPHLWTALGYVSIRNYLGVDPGALENENPVPDDQLPQLRNLMRWLFGSQSQNIEATVRRQNPDLRDLARALEVQKAAGYLGPELHRKAEAESEPLTLETLFDIYGEEVTPTKRGQSRLHDRAAMRMFLGCFGRDRKPATLSQRDWDRFIRERRAGRVGPSGKPVSDRMIERDLKFLLAVLNWAVKSRDERGELLLGSNPLKGLKTPTEKNPTRVMLTEEEYRVLLHVSLEMDWRFHVALVLAHETGHRIGAIRQLQWSDVDL